MNSAHITNERKNELTNQRALRARYRPTIHSFRVSRMTCRSSLAACRAWSPVVVLRPAQVAQIEFHGLFASEQGHEHDDPLFAGSGLDDPFEAGQWAFEHGNAIPGIHA